MLATRFQQALRAAVIGVLAVVSSVLFLGPAAADTATYLRLAHLSPDTPEVDVYVASVADPATPTVVLRGVGYGNVSDYQVLARGTYLVSMRPAGAAESTPAVISTTLEAAVGSAYTVAGVGAFADLGLTVLTDDLTLPPTGQARARVIQAAASQPQLDIAVQGVGSLGRDVEFATTTPYRNVAAGQWTLEVTADGQSLAELSINVDAGAVYSVLILDTPNGLNLAVTVDASSTGVVPTGGVESGAGGLAIGNLPGAVDSPGNPAQSRTAAWSTLLALSGVAALGLALFVAGGARIRESGTR